MSSAHQVRAVTVETGSRWGERSLLEAGIGVVAFALLTALGAQVRIPVPGTPVPVTLQTLFVLLAGAALGSVWGGASQALYIALHMLRAPGFTVGGAQSLGGPTTGYLIGFIVAAVVTGWLVHRGPDRSLAWLLLSMLVGSVGVYACGLAWLVGSLHLSVVDAFMKGMVPFLIGDMLKLSAAAGLARMADRDTVNMRIWN